MFRVTSFKQTNRDELCGRKLAHCADKGWPGELYRDHLFLAPYYHMTELQGAVGIAQLRKIDRTIEARRESALILSSLIRDIRGIFPPLEVDWAVSTYYEYALGIDPDMFSVDSTTLADALTGEGLQTAPSYLPKPIYMYDVVLKRDTHLDASDPIEYTEVMCPTAVEACRSMLFIPWKEKMTDTNSRDIAGAIRKVLTHFEKGRLML